MKKRFVSMFIVMILLVSTLGITTALAGAKVSIKGNSEVLAGKTYTYEVTVSANCFNFISQVSCGGVLSGSSKGCDANGSSNDSLSSTVKIEVKVAADAKPGDKGTISVKGEGCSVDENNTPVDSFSIAGSKSVTVVAASSEPSKPTKKPSTNKDKPKTSPTPTPPPTEWELANTQMEGLEQGGTLTVDITGEDRAIPASVYKALREKQGTMTMNFGAYSCTLNGAALGELGEDVESLNLGLSLERDEEFSTAIGGADVYQLHFSHSGDFPGKISFTFKADKSNPGDTVYLYYYRSASGVTEGIQSAVVDENGFVTFDIYHCSSYFVSGTVVEGAAGIVVMPEPEPTPEPTPSPTPEATPEPAEETVAPAPAGFSLAVLIAVGLGAALIAVLVTMIVCQVGPFKKKRRRFE